MSGYTLKSTGFGEYKVAVERTIHAQTLERFMDQPGRAGFEVYVNTVCSGDYRIALDRLLVIIVSNANGASKDSLRLSGDFEVKFFEWLMSSTRGN